MLYDLVSDLHVDTYPNWHFDFEGLKNSASSIMIIAGDTSNSVVTTLTVLTEASKAYDRVLFVSGNHEHYSNRYLNETVERDLGIFKKFAEDHPNVTFLDGTTYYQTDGVRFIGACGWYDFQIACPEFTKSEQQGAWQLWVNDARVIRFHKPVEEIAAEHARLLTEQVAAAQDDDSVKEIVVTTHTSPLLKGLRYRPGDIGWNRLNGSYGNSQMRDVLAADRNHKIKLWNFAHTHYENDFFDNGVRFVSHPRGYRNERTDWIGPKQIDTTETEGSAFGEIEK